MDFVKNILEEWGLSSIVHAFIENAIDETAFQMLTETDIKELIPVLGTRKKFSLLYNNYIVEKALIETEPTSIVAQNQNQELDSDNVSNASSTSTISNVSSSIIDLDGLEPQLYYSHKATLGAPFIISSFTTSPHDIVRKLLDNIEKGKIIKNNYGVGKKFLRNNLCQLIIKNEFKESQKQTISTERFKQLAREINDIFIHEDPEIYYLPYTRGRNNQVVAARGKLWSAYVHLRKIYRDVGLIKSKCVIDAPSTSRQETELAAENILICHAY